MRLFVALDVPEETRETLAVVISRLAKVCRGARWVRAEGLHVTLKFIGEVEEGAVPAMRESLAKIAPREPIEIAFRHFGFFPNERRPRVFWVGMEAGPALGELAAEIDARLQTVGIAHDDRAFRPHLTLARFDSTEGLAKLREEIAALGTQDFGGTVAREFHLYQSILKRGGAEYTRLATFPFARGSA